MAATGGLITWPKVVLFGDSITQFSYGQDGYWGAMLSDKLQRKCDVINRGFSGYNTRFCRFIAPRLFSRPQMEDVVAMTLFLGANDANTEKSPCQHVPLEEFRTNMAAIIDFLQSIGITKEKLIVIGLPACDDEAWEIEALKEGFPVSVSNDRAVKYAQVTQEVAEQCSVDYIDLYNHMINQQDWKSLLCDGLHFSRTGAEMFFKLLWPQIEKRTRHLPDILPEWDQIDYLAPENSFSENS